MNNNYMPMSTIECGLDEAGRGSLSGPVFTAAVVLPHNFSNDMINDSKKLSAKKRKTLVDVIKDNAIAYAIDWASVEEIDEVNILNATIKSMHRCIDLLNKKCNVDYIIVDGDRFRSYGTTPHTCIIGGDAKHYSIAAASILAKHFRDEHMKLLSNLRPEYGWSTNFGYGTKIHKAAIEEHGFCPTHHRKSFDPIKSMIENGSEG